MMNIELYPEICCEQCGEIIHNHFGCPACKEKWVSGWFGDADESNIGDILTCPVCKTEFVYVKRNGYYDYEFEVKI
jgi:hypothetical protein